jgi:uncharacterized protein YgbK (DUF1537 family)
MEPERVLVVADDLTGAVDAGHELATRGCPTTVSTDATPRGDTPGRAVTTDSRSDDPAAAAETVSAAVATATPATLVYKKVDSTLRGNLVAETDAALAATDGTTAAVAPAFPDAGRTTAAGYHLVDGRLVTDTAAVDDADGRVETAHLPTAFAASESPVHHAGVPTVARGRDAVRAALADGIVVCDAVHESHLAAVGDAAGEGTLFVGSAGLARHCPLPGAEARTPAVETPGPRPLAVVGSLAPATLDQVDRVPETRRVALDARAAVSDPRRAGTEAGAVAADLLADGTDAGAAVVSATARTDAAAARAAGRAAGVDGRTVRERVETALGTAARVAVDATTPSALLLSGGAVAAATLAALDARRIALSGRALEPGVPVGRLDEGAAAGRPVATKAGAFGTPRLVREWVVSD